jgi:hypothetical protein
MPTVYEFRTAWWLHIASPVFIAVCGLGVGVHQIITGGNFPGWFMALALAVAVFMVIALRRTLIHSARLTDDAVEVNTGAGSRWIPLADVERPSRITRSFILFTNMRTVNVAGGWFVVPGYSRRAADFLDDLASRTRT